MNPTDADPRAATTVTHAPPNSRVGHGVAVPRALATCLFASSVAFALPLVAQATDAGGTPIPERLYAAHTPPLLSLRGEPVVLAFDTVCVGTPCRSMQGSLFVRAEGVGEFTELTLVKEDRLLVATLPRSFAEADVLEYYASLEDTERGLRADVPVDGSAQPQRLWRLDPDKLKRIEIAAHAFGRTRTPDATRLQLPWGDKSGAAGLIDREGQLRIGPASFDVAPDGNVFLLDQVNTRLLRAGVDGSVVAIATDLESGMGSVAASGDVVAVMQKAGAGSVVRSYQPTGLAIGASKLNEPPSYLLRSAPGGVQWFRPGDNTWKSIGTEVMRGEAKAATAGAVHAGRLIHLRSQKTAPAELVVRMDKTALRMALISGNNALWATEVANGAAGVHFGALEFAELVGESLVVVFSVGADADGGPPSEYRVLHVRGREVLKDFSVQQGIWADRMVGNGFRLHGSNLLQMRSDPRGLEIVAFELEE